MRKSFSWRRWTSHEASWEGRFVGSHEHLMRSGPHEEVILLAAMDVS